MTCDKCPVSLVCLSGVTVIQECQNCHARIVKFLDGHTLFPLWVTVRCQGEPAAPLYSHCPRCAPLDYQFDPPTYHYHLARDGRVLTFNHQRWGKRQAWWWYRDLDEPKPPYPQEVPRGE